MGELTGSLWGQAVGASCREGCAPRQPAGPRHSPELEFHSSLK